MKAVKRIINAVWTLEYTLQPDGTVFIHAYSKDDPEGKLRERELPTVRIIEDAERTVTEVYITKGGVQTQHRVANPGFVFSWPFKEEGING
jgi:hypothetical protein